jgi:hypothetical protein
MNNLDLVLFHDSPRRLNPFTPSTWDHVGLVLKDPTWLHTSLKGTFIWETCDTGLQMTPIVDRLKNTPGRVYLRKASLAKKVNEDLLKDVSVRLEPNPVNALTSFLELKNPDTATWSANFIAYILVRMNFMNYHGIRNLSLKPNDFSPKQNVDKYLLPGLSYSDKLVKLR